MGGSVSPHHDDERALSSSTTSDPLERTMPVRGPHDPDRVSWPDVAVGEHAPMTPALEAAAPALSRPTTSSSSPAGIRRSACRVAQSGDLDDCVVAEVQQRSGGQAQQVDAAGW
jgi:hypothetical protein